MRRDRFIAALTASIFIAHAHSCATLFAQAQGAPQPSAVNEAGVLILQDGGVLAGQIKRDGDWYTISRAGGEMQVQSSRVMHTCKSLEDAYQYRRQQLGTPSVETHLALADWCLRYGLLGDAKQELADVRQLDPTHPRLALLERRLAKASEPPPISKTTSAAENILSTSEAKNQGALRQLSQPAATPAELSDGALEVFARKVQPILVNTCTTSGCHQSGGQQSFQLDRAILRGENNRRATMRNLEATLALIDREQPNKSPLLTIPHQRHGGMAAPIFGPRLEPAYKNLTAWVAILVPPVDSPAADTNEAANVAQMDTDVAANASDGPTESVDQVGNPESARRNPKVNNLAGSAPGPASPSASRVHQAAAVTEPATLRPPQQLKIGARLQTWQPRDAFDPEIFNRLQRPRAGSTRPVQPITAEQTE